MDIRYSCNQRDFKRARHPRYRDIIRRDAVPE